MPEIKKICKKCLLSEIDPALAEEAIFKYIEHIPADKRADISETKKRLDICLECTYLNEGTCAQCGCYVEIRASKKDITCPIGYWA